ncbi:hypothetical protein [Vibrio diazotrophicus]|uniref:hypothetical protein n=1 Tax=Vibrio diazotrophicus TaxID=685 RepID=UPI003D2F8D90
MTKCNCFNEMLEKVELSVKEQLKDTPMVEGSLKIDWQNRVFFIDGKPSAPIALYVNTEYQPLKRNGEPMKNKRSHQYGLKLSHCPFCGHEYASQESAA